jgi:hypothetical protein
MFKLIKEKILNLITKKTKIDFVSTYEYLAKKTDYVVCKKTVLVNYYYEHDYILFKKGNLYPADYFKDKVVGVWGGNLKFYSFLSPYNTRSSEVALISNEKLMFFKEHFKVQSEPHIMLEKKCNIF